MTEDWLKQALELRESGQAFVIATVVRAERPTSAKPGAKAIVPPDGSLKGWIGGSCAEPTVLREARKALRDGRPRLLRLSPPETLGRSPPEGVDEVPLTCVSGGTLEIYLEPHLPKPHLVLVGHFAVSRALCALATELGYQVSVMSPEATVEHFPRADRVGRDLDFTGIASGGETYIVVASHGNFDEEALEGAVATEASAILLVTSKKRAESLLQDLRSSNVPEERLARIKYPAGLDIGAETPEEIAVSILAELVQLRRQRRSQAKAAEETEVKDPVCGMTVEAESARYQSVQEGRVYAFCSAGCLRTFEKDPSAFLVGQKTGR